MKNSFPASRLDIDQDILGSTKIETITDLLLGEILADLEELILAHRSAAVFVHVLEHLDNYDNYDKSKHLKGQLDLPVRDVTFLDQGGQLDPP